MKKTTRFLALIFCSVFFLVSCSDDDAFTPPEDSENPENPENPEEPGEEEGKYAQGIFVLNEGGVGTVTYLSEDLETVEQAIFQQNNNGEDIGAYAQSIFFEDDLAFIISNGSNLITVVNRDTFELVARIDSGLDVPYYGVAENGKAYVTNLASFDSGEDDYVAVIDLQSYEVENTVTVGDYVANIEEENGKLYIQNSNYGSGGSVTVMNMASMQIENVISTADGLNSFEIENGNLYALTGTKLQTFNLSNTNLLNEMELAYGTAEEPLLANNLNIEDDQVYFTVENSVYKFALGETNAPNEALFSYETSSAYGVMYGFEVENNRIFVADGGDFASDSFVKIYDIEGNLIKTQEVGIAPNGFYFNE
ncbi:YncE family protein [Mesonia aquimarina]|uniref:YncE family protein n=1 Tax=Mesonia aquimarina TaxID=1504967 RepID=UPI000EF599CE|nr:DUF5074 domain-containing protein [Mesonia aquimarina]